MERKGHQRMSINTKPSTENLPMEAIVKIGTMLAVLLALLLVLTLWRGGSRPVSSVQAQTPTAVARAAQDAASAPSVDQATTATTAMAATEQHEMPAAQEAASVPVVNQAAPAQAAEATVSYTLRTVLGHEGMRFIGVGGDIEGIENPDLLANLGDTVQITLVNGDGIEHNVALPDFNVGSEHLTAIDSQTVITFLAGAEGIFPYFCDIPGHRQAGMEGRLVIGANAQAEAVQGTATLPSIVRLPTEVGAPVGNRPPTTLRVDLTTVEVEGQLAEGTTYTYWTFDGAVPGPFLRVRQGDTVELHLKNDPTSHMAHSIDLHAVTGPGGGAAVMQVAPGHEKAFIFQALNPGLYVYHCATPMVAHHMTNGMYGLILVEPAGGLPPVDHEFYVMQGELYTLSPFGTAGKQEFSQEKLLAEASEYVVFNGAVGSLTTQHPLTASVGQTVRIFFGVGGPNLTSSFHVIGEIFDRVYDQASLTAAPLTDVQTTLVPPGGATMVEFKLEVPGRYILVDHALSRMERGLAGFLEVDGAPNPAVFQEVALQ
jgi:nitrite reductase (NO-forming)